MSLSIFEQYALREFAEDYISQVKQAIKTKPIARRTRAQGSFSAVANATGRLAESLREDYNEGGMLVYIFDYIDKLLFGQAPGEVGAITSELFEVEKWMIAKGLDYNPYTVLENINRHGSSIWQEHKGADSGLFDNIDIDGLVFRLQSKLGENYADLLMKEIKLAA